MKETTRVLAFDYGASSGRAILCSYQEGRLSLQEVHRFDNEPVEKDGTLFWNLEDLYQNLLTGLEKARDAGGFDSVGVDTWGVDFGLLGADGALLEAPVHYRDGRTNGLSDEVCGRIGEEALYERTGSQRMDINTLYQLYSLQKSRPEFLGKAACLLPIPNLFEYLLTGEKHAEWTEASTTQMLNLETKEWNFPLLEELGLPVSLLPKLVRPGTVTGRLKDELCARLGVPAVPVVSVATHDTASAVLAAPAEGGGGLPRLHQLRHLVALRHRACRSADQRAGAPVQSLQ